jgi:hypothetical protein
MNNLQTEVNCTLCHGVDLQTMIDFGLQPPSNRFVKSDPLEQDPETHLLALGYCQDCGTAQLTARMPVEAIRPPYAWLSYNEPEGHLDDVAAQLAQLPQIGTQSRILGITYKDQSTIDRLANLQLPHGACISEQDFGFTDGHFGLETIQQLLRNPEIIIKMKEKYGVANILLMRHIIEHTDNAAELLTSVKGLLAPDGYLVLELPDSAQIFENANHAFIWEEHISYYTEQSLTTLAKTVNAEIAWFQRYQYPYEDSLVVALRFLSSPTQPSTHKLETSTQEKLKKFGHDLEVAKQQWRKTLLRYKMQGEKIAIFGAGHLAVKFINFLQLSDLIDCVIDDNPNKTGMKMPGSLLPILPSAELTNNRIGVCISTLSPESEIKVRHKLSAYFDNGGVWLSAFTVTTS